MNNSSSPSRRPEVFISCGMYAFTDPLKQAWQALFDGFLTLFEYPAKIKSRLVFDGAHHLLRDDGLFIGHTCGYPLMRYLQNDVTPICVPVFNVTGCRSTLYSSAFIVAQDSELNTLADCHQRIAVINAVDSNSGMNVFRHAIAELNSTHPYFSGVRESGSHLQSLTDVASGLADIAAIDCVSFALIKDAWPELAARVRAIGYSAQTCGLPFVAPLSLLDRIESKAIVNTLNLAVEQLTVQHRKTLHLSHFEEVSLADFGSITSLENLAIDAGYPQLV